MEVRRVTPPGGPLGPSCAAAAAPAQPGPGRSNQMVRVSSTTAMRNSQPQVSSAGGASPAAPSPAHTITAVATTGAPPPPAAPPPLSQDYRAPVRKVRAPGMEETRSNLVPNFTPVLSRQVSAVMSLEATQATRQVSAVTSLEAISRSREAYVNESPSFRSITTDNSSQQGVRTPPIAGGDLDLPARIQQAGNAPLSSCTGGTSNQEHMSAIERSVSAPLPPGTASLEPKPWVQVQVPAVLPTMDQAAEVQRLLDGLHVELGQAEKVIASASTAQVLTSASTGGTGAPDAWQDDVAVVGAPPAPATAEKVERMSTVSTVSTAALEPDPVTPRLLASRSQLLPATEDVPMRDRAPPRGEDRAPPRGEAQEAAFGRTPPRRNPPARRGTPPRARNQAGKGDVRDRSQSPIQRESCQSPIQQPKRDRWPQTVQEGTDRNSQTQTRAASQGRSRAQSRAQSHSARAQSRSASPAGSVRSPGEVAGQHTSSRPLSNRGLRQSQLVSPPEAKSNNAGRNSAPRTGQRRPKAPAASSSLENQVLQSQQSQPPASQSELRGQSPSRRMQSPNKRSPPPFSAGGRGQSALYLSNAHNPWKASRQQTTPQPALGAKARQSTDAPPPVPMPKARQRTPNKASQGMASSAAAFLGTSSFSRTSSPPPQGTSKPRQRTPSPPRQSSPKPQDRAARTQAAAPKSRMSGAFTPGVPGGRPTEKGYPRPKAQAQAQPQAQPVQRDKFREDGRSAPMTPPGAARQRTSPTIEAQASGPPAALIQSLEDYLPGTDDGAPKQSTDGPMFSKQQALQDKMQLPIEQAPQHERPGIAVEPGVDATDDVGRTQLMQAAGEGDVDAVRSLLNRGAAVDATDQCQCTALMYAATYGHLHVASILVDGGASVEATSKDGWTPLITASYNGHAEVVCYLLARSARINAADERGWTSLMHVAFNGDNKTLCCLLDHDACVDALDVDGRTALVYAAFSGHLENVRCLLERSDHRDRANTGFDGRSVDHREHEDHYQLALESARDTAVLFAAIHGHSEVVRLLLEVAVASAETKHAALKLAADHGHDLVVDLLMQHTEADLRP